MKFNFPKLENQILKFWEENKIFEKSLNRRRKAPNFVFYEGPPTANAKPGIHHVLARVYKDIICRFKTMKGFLVLRKAGWDTHGLPVELEIEKKLGLRSKKEIEKYGLAKFNKKCRESVWQYKKDWEELTRRIGFWLEMKNPYITYENDYIETLWWIIKKIWQKGLLYKDYKVLPYCPRCETSLSSHEVALGYKKIKEPAIYLKFPLKSQNQKFKTYFLVWTTTPWTLPANVALAVNPQFSYLKVKRNEEIFILAKERLEILEGNYKVLAEIKGEKLLGIRYQPLFPEILSAEKKHRKASLIYLVVAGDFVSLTEGTGLVHLAPAFGQEDLEVAKKNNLAILMTVTPNGCLTFSGKEWAGKFVKEADPLIIENLRKRNLLFKEELYEHDYPFCWRCDSPLLYYAKESWFIRMEKVKNDLIKNNQKINWIPSHLKEGRFGEWLRELKDWAFSRERYWGTPLPIWQCQNCQKLEVIGSFEELLSQKFSTNTYYLFRHGHSLRQVKKVSISWPEKIYCPLTPKGRREVKRAAKKLKKKKIDLIFSSDLLRTKETAEILAREIGRKIIFDKRLREYNVGIFNGQDPELVWEYLKKKGDLISLRLPQGESLIELKKRVIDFLQEINHKYKNKNILIVSHEFPLSFLEGSLRGWPIEKILKERKAKKRLKPIETGSWRKIEFRDLPFDEKMELDFHRPFIDKVKFYCSFCFGLMERVPEVIDCWFDSGSMPFAQYHYPFEKKNLIDKKIQFPADFISEAVDQTRGWFYTLLAISTLLNFGPAYKNVISLGHVLDEKGEKMSKSKGNVVDPWEIIEKYGSEALRWYFYTVNQPADAKCFSEKEVVRSFQRFILTFWNSYLFFQTYGKKLPPSVRLTKKRNFLDRWIISRLNEIILGVEEKLNKYDVSGAARQLENFLINDLSQWYIRRSRKRFQNPETSLELKEASTTLAFLLLTLSKISAPFLPFLTEKIYQELSTKTRLSVHLEDWPKANKKLINKTLNQKMEEVRRIVGRALAERAKYGLKVRQPLSKLEIPQKIDKEGLVLIKEEVNVKEIIFGQDFKLDIKLTPALKEEGWVREIIRWIQGLRKEVGLKPKDKVIIQLFGKRELNKILEKNKKIILEKTKAKSLILKEKGKETFSAETKIKVGQKDLFIGIKKI